MSQIAKDPWEGKRGDSPGQTQLHSVRIEVHPLTASAECLHGSSLE
jgi:hypothetical protein